MAIFGRKRPSMGRVRQQAAPTTRAPVAQQRAVAAQTKAPVAQRTGIAPAPAQKMPGAPVVSNNVAARVPVPPDIFAKAAALQAAQQRPNPNMSIPMETMRAAPAQAQRTGSAPAVSQQQIAKDITAQNAIKGNNMMPQASRDADERFLEKQAQKAKATFAPVAQVPSPPPFRKGGAVKKKTGYAKGGAVMCGASMPPAQKRKK